MQPLLCEQCPSIHNQVMSTNVASVSWRDRRPLGAVPSGKITRGDTARGRECATSDDVTIRHARKCVNVDAAGKGRLAILSHSDAKGIPGIAIPARSVAGVRAACGEKKSAGASCDSRGISTRVGSGSAANEMFTPSATAFAKAPTIACRQENEGSRCRSAIDMVRDSAGTNRRRSWLSTSLP